MKGPYLLESTEIDAKVDKNKMGNYQLGSYKNENFNILYIGRSDTCLNKRLKDHIEEDGFEKCTHFKYEVQSCVTAAYEKECKDYHYHSPQLNKYHPDQPSNHGKTIYCPVPSCEK